MRFDSAAQAYTTLYESVTDFMITEELHPDIKSKLSLTNTYPATRFTELTKTVRTLIKSGQDTGLTDDKPKKGSSRAVMFAKEPARVKIDGVDAELPHVLKMSFHGSLDKYREGGSMSPLLGDMQNMHEIDHAHHSVLVKQDDGTFRTNPRGFLPPIIDHHSDGHWMSVGRVSPVTSTEFKQLTKHADFPKGITANEFRAGLIYHTNAAHGKETPDYMLNRVSTDRAEKLIDHPLVQKAIDFTIESNTNPYDFGNRNLGIWEHPVTKERHIVAADAGFSNNVMKAYTRARMNMAKRR